MCSLVLVILTILDISGVHPNLGKQLQVSKGKAKGPKKMSANKQAENWQNLHPREKRAMASICRMLYRLRVFITRLI